MKKKRDELIVSTVTGMGLVRLMVACGDRELALARRCRVTVNLTRRVVYILGIDADGRVITHGGYPFKEKLGYLISGSGFRWPV